MRYMTYACMDSCEDSLPSGNEAYRVCSTPSHWTNVVQDSVVADREARLDAIKAIADNPQDWTTTHQAWEDIIALCNGSADPTD